MRALRLLALRLRPASAFFLNETEPILLPVRMSPTVLSFLITLFTTTPWSGTACLPKKKKNPSTKRERQQTFSWEGESRRRVGVYTSTQFIVHILFSSSFFPSCFHSFAGLSELNIMCICLSHAGGRRGRPRAPTHTAARRSASRGRRRRRRGGHFGEVKDGARGLEALGDLGLLRGEALKTRQKKKESKQERNKERKKERKNEGRKEENRW